MGVTPNSKMNTITTTTTTPTQDKLDNQHITTTPRQDNHHQHQEQPGKTPFPIRTLKLSTWDTVSTWMGDQSSLTIQGLSLDAVTTNTLKSP